MKPINLNAKLVFLMSKLDCFPFIKKDIVIKACWGFRNEWACVHMCGRLGSGEAAMRWSRGTGCSLGISTCERKGQKQAQAEAGLAKRRPTQRELWRKSRASGCLEMSWNGSAFACLPHSVMRYWLPGKGVTSREGTVCGWGPFEGAVAGHCLPTTCLTVGRKPFLKRIFAGGSRSVSTIVCVCPLIPPPAPQTEFSIELLFSWMMVYPDRIIWPFFFFILYSTIKRAIDFQECS